MRCWRNTTGSADAGDKPALAEAIYHANRLDWQRGVDDWVSTFDARLARSDYESCRVLLEVRTELKIESKFEWAQVSQSEGEFFSTLARYAEAATEYAEAISAYDAVLGQDTQDIAAHNNKGIALGSLGALQAQLGQHGPALASYQAAVAAYDEALRRAPDDVDAHNNKGIALRRLGALQAQLEMKKGSG